MTLFLQQISTGLLVGGIYALVAVGFVVIYKATETLNFAQGEFLLLGAYMGWGFTTALGLPFWAALLLGLAVGLFIGFGLERYPLRQLMGQSMLSLVMLTIGLSVIVRAIVMIIWHARHEAYPQVIPVEPLLLGNLTLSQGHLYGFTISIVFVIILTLFFRYAKMGLTMRAVFDDNIAAKSAGLPLNRVVGLSWGIGIIVGIVGGMFLGVISGAHVALSEIGMKAIAVALFGGLDSILGAVCAGLLVGLIEALATAYIGHGIGDIAAFIVLVLALVIRPYGLFGLKRIERI